MCFPSRNNMMLFLMILLKFITSSLQINSLSYYRIHAYLKDKSCQINHHFETLRYFYYMLPQSKSIKESNHFQDAIAVCIIKQHSNNYISLHSQMRGGNLEVLPDRRLFHNFKNSFYPQQQETEKNALKVPPPFVAYLASMQSIFDNYQQYYQNAISKLDRRLHFVALKVKRIQIAIKPQLKKKLFSFANSPNGKNSHNLNASQLKNSEFLTVPKLCSYNDEDSQQQESSYLKRQLKVLKHQIAQLRNTFNEAHHPSRMHVLIPDVPRSLFFEKQDSKRIKSEAQQSYPENDDDSFQQKVQTIQNAQINKLKVIIRQHEKEAQMYRKKNEKLKVFLRALFEPLESLKREIVSYPCEACQLKIIIDEFLQQKDARGEECSKKRDQKKERLEIQRLEIT